MNVLIVDMDKMSLDIAYKFFKKARDTSGTTDWILLPKDMDLLQDVHIDWLKMIRRQIDKEIKRLEVQI